MSPADPPRLDRAALEALVPHAGAMCLLDLALDWDDEHIHCRSVSHQNPKHPLACDGRLAALHLAEYGAQAMAVHGGVLAAAGGGAAAPGYLAALKNVELYVETVGADTPALDVKARRLLSTAEGLIYEFEVSAADERLATGRAVVASLRG